MKKKVLLRAPLLTQSGYGTHSRQIFRWLESKSDEYDFWVNTVPWGNTSWYIDEKRLNGLVGRIMKKTGQAPGDIDISIQVQLPNEWDYNIGRFNIGVTAGVETDKCNPAWAHNINKMDLVIVPSEHTRNALLSASGIQTKIEVVPEAFIDEVINEDIPMLDLSNIKTDFNFLIFGQITGGNDETDRKNTYKTLKWLCELFRKDKDVGIIIKTNSARNSLFDRSNTKDLLKNALKYIRGENEDMPPVYFLHGELSNKEVASLYRHPKVKGLVALTRGEGFGLPILEAAASGLPVIATNWSAHTEFLNKGKFLNVDYSLNSIAQAKIDKRACPSCRGQGKVGPMSICNVCGGTGFTQIFMEGAKWAEPKETSAKKVIKKFREMPDKPKEWAKELSEKLREEYSQEAIQKHYDRVFSDIGI